MTDTQTLDDLIERLERASGPDRELDGLIACAVFETVYRPDDLIYVVPIRKDDECAAGTYWNVSRSGRSLQTAPAYTASIDNALMIVPEGHDWALHCDNGEAIAGCMQASEDGCDISDCRAATPALAIVIAALRARKALTKETP